VSAQFFTCWKCDEHSSSLCPRTTKRKKKRLTTVNTVEMDSKAARRERARFKARYGPRGGMSDRRPAAVRSDRGAIRRLRKALDRAASDN
jgi:hypothetical protein